MWGGVGGGNMFQARQLQEQRLLGGAGEALEGEDTQEMSQVGDRSLIMQDLWDKDKEF